MQIPSTATHTILSDLHLGSPYCNAPALNHFIDNLPPRTELILNGDVLDRWHDAMPETHVALLNSLVRIADTRQVVWLRGNHDQTPEPREIGNIIRADEWSIDQRLLIRHGHQFDLVMHHNGFALGIFKLAHLVYLRFSDKTIHPAQFAKRFRRLYNALRRHVASNAIRYARKRGFPAITCGHTHAVEDHTTEGIRYINTGSWTEHPYCTLVVEPEHIHLMRRDNEV